MGCGSCLPALLPPLEGLLLLLPIMLAVKALLETDGCFLFAAAVLDTKALVASGLSVILLLFFRLLLLFIDGTLGPWIVGSVTFRFRRRFFLEDFGGDDDDDDKSVPFFLRFFFRVDRLDISISSSSSLLLRSRASKIRSVSSIPVLVFSFVVWVGFRSSKSQNDEDTVDDDDSSSSQFSFKDGDDEYPLPPSELVED